MSLSQSIKIRYWGIRERLPSYLHWFQNELSLARLKLKGTLLYHAFRRSTTEISGTRCRFGLHMSLRILEKVYKGNYERPELKMIRANLSDDDIVMELGSGIGLIAAFCAKKIGSNRIYTFEGNPALVPYIHDTFELNDVLPHFENCLVGNTDGRQTFYIRKAFWASSTIPHKYSTPTQVRCRRFNDELIRIKPTFLIIDIEGGEWELSKNMELDGVNKVAIEVHPGVLGWERIRLVEQAFLDAGFELKEEFSTDQHFFFVKPEFSMVGTERKSMIN